MPKDAFISISSDKYFHDLASTRIDYRNELVSNWIPRKPDLYIIEEYGTGDLEYIIRKMSNFSVVNFNPRAKYCFIGENITVDSLKLISSLYISDMMFLNPEALDFCSSITNDEEHFIKNTKFHKDICKTRFQQETTVNLNSQQHLKNLGVSTISAVYEPSEMYSLCHNCRNKGILLEILEVILDFLKIKIEYHYMQELSESEIFEKYNVYLRTYRSEDLYFTEFTMSCLADEISWIVPSSKPMPRWKYLRYIFSPTVWLFFLVITFISSAIWTSSNYIFDGRVTYFEMIVAVFELFLEQNNKIRKEYVHRAIMVICLIFLAYFMNVFLKCRFTYLLNGLNYQYALNSFDDIMKYQIRIGLPRFMIPFVNTTSEISDYFEEFYVECDGSRLCLERSAFQNDIAVFKPARKARAFIRSYMIKLNGEVLLNEIKPPFVVVHHFIHFQRGHPLFPSFNKHLYNLVETGIADKIISKYDPKIQTVEEIFTEQRALKMEHLVIPLVIWMVGIINAFLFFTIEKILWKNTV
ncbi:hypothetical protein HHI36_014342 [Cryptolaemus montrouzieri]|uniref:Ionotropic receptor n=1 Tax=Cryptolaemus montrouzieri TaxID=559131 RepID=A0ABD2N2W1_9CUCU